MSTSRIESSITGNSLPICTRTTSSSALSRLFDLTLGFDSTTDCWCWLTTTMTMMMVSCQQQKNIGYSSLPQNVTAQKSQPDFVVVDTFGKSARSTLSNALYRMFSGCGTFSQRQIQYFHACFLDFSLPKMQLLSH